MWLTLLRLWFPNAVPSDRALLSSLNEEGMRIAPVTSWKRFEQGMYVVWCAQATIYWHVHILVNFITAIWKSDLQVTLSLISKIAWVFRIHFNFAVIAAWISSAASFWIIPDMGPFNLTTSSPYTHAQECSLKTMRVRSSLLVCCHKHAGRMKVQTIYIYMGPAGIWNGQYDSGCSCTPFTPAGW